MPNPEGDEVGEVTRLLQACEADDHAALDRLLPLIYRELRHLARRHLRRLPGCRTLDTTGLVHEAYTKLARARRLRLKDRGHLMALTARAMRQVLVTRSRARLRGKRGSGARELAFDETVQSPTESDAEQLIDLDRALRGLRGHSEELASIFECRYFGGFSEEETAEALGLSLRAAQRGWMRARAWLRAGLEGHAQEEDSAAA
jgi:RNA polymerase sigma factor (TIGR02999 family)